jgi:hypothetical protein
MIKDPQRLKAFFLPLEKKKKKRKKRKIRKKKKIKKFQREILLIFN